jgi:hypothetical protein
VWIEERGSVEVCWCGLAVETSRQEGIEVCVGCIGWAEEMLVRVCHWLRVVAVVDFVDIGTEEPERRCRCLCGRVSTGRPVREGNEVVLHLVAPDAVDCIFSGGPEREVVAMAIGDAGEIAECNGCW